jgi:hypothetical protein
VPGRCGGPSAGTDRLVTEQPPPPPPLQEYCDGPPGKLGAAAVGLLCAVVATVARRRTPAWLGRGAAAGAAP